MKKLPKDYWKPYKDKNGNENPREIKEVLEKYFEISGRQGYYSIFKKQFEKYYPSNNASVNAGNQLRRHIVYNTEDKRSLNQLYNIIRALYFGFNIPYEYFGAYKKHIVTEHSPLITSHPRFLSIRNSNDRNSDFKNKYTNFVGECFSRIDKKLLIYDYMGKGNQKFPGQSIEHYLEVNDDIYESIFEIVDTKKNVEYIRVMALPIYLHFQEKEIERDPRNIAKYILHECSYQLFRHICKCVRKFKATETKSARAKFFVSRMPSRMYQFAIIDDSLIYNEYYQITDNAGSIPSFIFSNDIEKDKEMEKFLNIYKDEFNDRSKDLTYTIHEDNLPIYFRDLIDNFYLPEWENFKKNKKGLFMRSGDKLRFVVNEKIDAFNEEFKDVLGENGKIDNL